MKYGNQVLHKNVFHDMYYYNCLQPYSAVVDFKKSLSLSDFKVLILKQNLKLNTKTDSTVETPQS